MLALFIGSPKRHHQEALRFDLLECRESTTILLKISPNSGSSFVIDSEG